MDEFKYLFQWVGVCYNNIVPAFYENYELGHIVHSQVHGLWLTAFITRNKMQNCTIKLSFLLISSVAHCITKADLLPEKRIGARKFYRVRYVDVSLTEVGILTSDWPSWTFWHQIDWIEACILCQSHRFIENHWNGKCHWFSEASIQHLSHGWLDYTNSSTHLPYLKRFLVARMKTERDITLIRVDTTLWEQKRAENIRGSRGCVRWRGDEEG